MHQEKFNKLYNQIEELLNQEVDTVSNLSNITSIIYSYMEDVNYVGFYIAEDIYLISGPFQGKGVRTRIKIANKNGISGTAAYIMQTIIADNVKDFVGYIEFDPATKSKIALPIIDGKDIFGILALESESLNRFTKAEQNILQEITELISNSVARKHKLDDLISSFKGQKRL